MGKSKQKSKQDRPEKHSKQGKATPLVSVGTAAFDPALSSLFATSSGPVQAPVRPRDVSNRKDKQSDDDEEDDEEISSASSADDDEDSDDSEDDEEKSASSDASADNAELAAQSMIAGTDKSKKRKRGGQEEIEEAYMRKLAREEEKDEAERQKKRKTADSDDEEDSEDSGDEENSGDSDEESDSNADSDAESASDSDAAMPDAPVSKAAPLGVPQHESLAPVSATDSELEKASRTVFLSNVSSECINSKPSEKALKKHLESFIADLADSTPPHKIESIRFRSTAFTSSLPKRAAFAKKELMESTTKSTNAYAVYTTKTAAREAVKRLNGSMLLSRHLHVDSVAHPAPTDNRRCVFVGNLPFVDDESQGGANPDSKRKAPADIEEGLWVQFSKVAPVESVRVVRDPQTRVGKGFAYVQFKDVNGVEAGLQLHEKKFPPMLPRILRVTRCRAEKKKDKARVAPPTKQRDGRDGIYNKKLSAEEKSSAGRAKAVLGKAAAAASKGGFVFEGHRAKEGQGKSGLKFGGAKKGAKKGPNGRKSRSAGWKAKK